MFTMKLTKNMAKLGKLVPKEGSSFAFNNACLQKVAGMPVLVAVDGRALVYIPADPEAQGRALVPPDALKVDAKGGTLDHTDTEVKTTDAKGTRTVPRPPDHPDTFPDVEKVLPSSEPLAQGMINIRLLITALEALLANEGNPYDGTEGDEAAATMAFHPLTPNGHAIVMTYGKAKAVVMGITPRNVPTKP